MAKTRADQIRLLTEKWLETGDNSILNELEHTIHDGVHFKVGNRRILERYKQLSLELHAHFFRLGDVRSINDDVCAVAQYFGNSDTVNEAVAVVDDPTVLVNKGNFLFTRANGSQRKCSVLVDVHELVQDPEGMKMGIRLVSLVRLQTLNECFRLNGYATESILFNVTGEPCGREGNGKHVFLDRGSVISENQLPDNVIESRAQIVQALSDYDAQPQTGSRQAESKMESAIHVRVALGQNAAIFETGLDFGLYRCKMFLCPDEFLPNAVERMIHDEENSKDPEGPRDTNS